MAVARGASRPLPYEGPDEERLRRLGQCYVEDQHGPDRSGAVRYAFHELGFRGPSFVDAPLRVLVAGESDAFGLGVEWEHSWPVLVVEQLRQALGLQASDVAMLNIACCGLGNEAIARQLLTQCEAMQPDLVLVNLAEWRRTEGVVDGAAFHIGAWYEHPEAPSQVEMLSERRGDDRPQRMYEAGRSYLQFSNPDHACLATLRAVLWMQEYLLRRGVPAFATCRPDLMPKVDGGEPAMLAALADMLDREFVQAHDQRHDDADRGSDDLHYGPRAHATVARSVWRRVEASGVVSQLAAAIASRRAPADVGATVRSFYDAMPFNLHGSVAEAARSIREHDLSQSYPDLHRHLVSGEVRRVLEFGCGAGWLACTVAHHYGAQVTGVDFASKALQRADAVAKALGVGDRVRWVEKDLLAHAPKAPVDLVVSVGVLHHTEDARAAFAHVQRFVRPGGAVFVGLYHAPGRQPFLKHFRELVAREGERAALRRYRELDGVRAGDDELVRSWFRDQVLHPHETQHTLRELCEWFADSGLRLCSTSINRFAAIDDERQLFDLEAAYEERARRVLEDEGRYFPGFFTALALRE